MIRVFAGARPAVGSSTSTTRGFVINARATPRRFRCPTLTPHLASDAPARYVRKRLEHAFHTWLYRPGIGVGAHFQVLHHRQGWKDVRRLWDV